MLHSDHLAVMTEPSQRTLALCIFKDQLQKLRYSSEFVQDPLSAIVVIEIDLITQNVELLSSHRFVIDFGCFYHVLVA